MRINTKPTPGPWFYLGGSVWTTPGGPDDGGACIALRGSLNDPTKPEPIDPVQKDANLRLCSKAPAMRDALKTLRNDCRAILRGDDMSGMSDNDLFGAMLSTINAALKD